MAAKNQIDRVTTNLNDKLAKHRNSVPNGQNIWQKQVSQLKLHIGKPFTMMEGQKQMRDVKKCVNNKPCLVEHVPWNICLVTKHRQTQREPLSFALIERRLLWPFQASRNEDMRKDW